MPYDYVHKDDNAFWHSVLKEGNPKEDGKYIVTYIDEAGNYEVTVARWQTNNWWLDHSFVVAYMYLPEAYSFQLLKNDFNQYKKE